MQALVLEKLPSITSEVIQCLPQLDPHRFCAVILLNSATEEIKLRISKEIKIQSNLFIGTIHSFLIRFIFEPFAHLLKISEIEKFYIDESRFKNQKNPYVAKSLAINIAENFLKKGIITFDQILKQALVILKKTENLKQIVQIDFNLFLLTNIKIHDCFNTI